ncbi:MAG: Mfa1 fimbrilin C-terminal domain-containing protein [Muribaculaceae bacterium]|nr:Mfa1 fimbrilin C-terminal domain-containing protein [Muribaculaceae bacterium]
MVLFAGILITLLFLPACTDELLSLAGPDYDYGSVTVVDLPGKMGISLAQNNNASSRASSDGHDFNDGLQSEFALAAPAASENYHYLLLYGNDASSTPLVFPIDLNEVNRDPVSSDNITLLISKVFRDGTESEDGRQFNTVKEFVDNVKNMQPYVLLNFKLVDSGYGDNNDEPNYAIEDNPGFKLVGENTVAKLCKLKKSEIEQLQLKNYYMVPSNSSQRFFIMSSSVYSDREKKVIDGKIDPGKIYTSEEEAQADPALTVHLERVASKVTVSFNTSLMAQANFDPYGDMRLKGVETDPETNLPVLNLEVQKVDMTNGTGITIDGSGYHILTTPVDAKIKIIGYGVSNMEPSTLLFKNINYSYPAAERKEVNWNWTDPINHRSYWSQDPNKHYSLAKTNDGVFTKVKGYPHQFRLALDTDSVTSLHSGLTNGYQNYVNFISTYFIDGKPYDAYKLLGNINPEAKINGAYLNYKSFDKLTSDFSNIKSTQVSNGTATTSYSPIYSLENTYYDLGMASASNWQWPWHRAPYGVATNLVILAEIEFDNNAFSSSDDPDYKDKQGDKGVEGGNSGGNDGDVSSGVAEKSYGVRTVYLGQNNIFYLRKVNLLKSKLEILNQVMLSGGNAGIQILHGQWDRHLRWDDDDENQFEETHLDKVAWNEGSKLWFAEVAWRGDDNNLYSDDQEVILEEKKEDGTLLPGPIYKKHEIKNEEGEVTGYTYEVMLKEEKLVTIDNASGVSDDTAQFLDLIPAEISGGDGQCLIAPHENYMGERWRYYLAPADPNDETKMDRSQAVEISYNHLVALIHKIIGPVDVYTQGKMYYSVPIPHRIQNNNNPTSWARMGSFSMVRNNWYNISVTNFTRLGTPVHDLLQPIVPVMDVKRSYINMGVELLNWHDVVEDNIPMM